MLWISICSWPEPSSHVGTLNFSRHCQFGGGGGVGRCFIGLCRFAFCHCNLPVFLQDSLGEQESCRLLGKKDRDLLQRRLLTQHLLSPSTEKSSRAPRPGKTRGSRTGNSSHLKGTTAQLYFIFEKRSLKDCRPAFSGQVFKTGLWNRFSLSFQLRVHSAFPN